MIDRISLSELREPIEGVREKENFFAWMTFKFYLKNKRVNFVVNV